MISFLNSTVLFAAAAALIPLLIHLFSKRRVKVVEFSSLKHLRSMQRRQVRRLRIRQLLLLALRMLIVFAFVLAFARPTTTGGAFGSHASVSAIVLFDNSASMNRYAADGKLFELAKQRARELVESFGESDEICVMPLFETSENAAGRTLTSPAGGLQLLERIQPGHGPANFDAAISTAAEMLEKASNLNKELYIIGDQQRTSLPDIETNLSTDIRLYFVLLPIEENDNIGITSIDPGGRLIIPGQSFELKATVKNYASRDRDDIIASLFLDGARVAQTDVVLGGGEETSVRFSANLSRGGFHSGSVELSDDRFAGDNRYFFSFSIPDIFNVLIIDGDESAPLVQLALAPSAAVGRYWSVKTTTPTQMTGVNFNDYDVVFLTGAPKMSTTLNARLKSFVRQGGALFISYGGATDIGYFNQTWSEASGVTFDEPVGQDISRAGYYTFDQIDVDHPIFSPFNFKNQSPPEVKFFALPRASVARSSATLLRFTGGRPALIENRYEDGSVLTFAGPMAPYYTDLTGHAFFVPFMSRIAEYLASDMSGLDVALYIGDNIVRSVALEGSVNAPLDMTAPDSAVYSVVPVEDGGALTVHAEPVEAPGVYHLSYRGREIDRFAANVFPAECDLAPADIDQFAAAVGAEEYREIELSKTIAAAVAELRFGKELWQMFLWLAALLIAFELLLSRGARPSE